MNFRLSSSVDQMACCTPAALAAFAIAVACAISAQATCVPRSS
jgi:hypothetical protein